MLLHDVELTVAQAAVLGEDVCVYLDLPEVVQQSAERNERQILFWQVTEHPHHRREDGDVDTVCKCVGVVCADVRKLHKVFMIIKETKDNRIRHLLQCRDIEGPVFFNGLECVVDSADRIDTRLLLDHIRRRWKLVAWIH